MLPAYFVYSTYIQICKFPFLWEGKYHKYILLLLLRKIEVEDENLKRPLVTSKDVWCIYV